MKAPHLVMWQERTNSHPGSLVPVFLNPYFCYRVSSVLSNILAIYFALWFSDLVRGASWLLSKLCLSALHLPQGAKESCQRALSPSWCPKRRRCSWPPRSPCQPHPSALCAGLPPFGQSSSSSSSTGGRLQPGASPRTQVSSQTLLCSLVGRCRVCLSAPPPPSSPPGLERGLSMVICPSLDRFFCKRKS